MNFVRHFQQSDSARERSGFVRTSSPFKTLREKLAPKNPVFLEKNDHSQNANFKKPQKQAENNYGSVGKRKNNARKHDGFPEFVKRVERGV
jgi:hypothetical protein